MKRIILGLLIINLVLPVEAAFWNRIDKAVQRDLEGKGYAGTLPNLNKNNPKKQNRVMTPIYESQNGFDNPTDLKPVPTDIPAYVDIIQKKGIPSQYEVDTTEIVAIMEKLLDCIEDNPNNVQLFVTRANVLTMNLDYVFNKYNNQPEGNTESFKKLNQVNQYTKSVVLLRREANQYKRYLAYQTTGSIYNPENINQQIEYLKEEINAAIILLKQNY